MHKTDVQRSENRQMWLGLCVYLRLCEKIKYEIKHLRHLRCCFFTLTVFVNDWRGFFSSFLNHSKHSLDTGMVLKAPIWHWYWIISKRCPFTDMQSYSQASCDSILVHFISSAHTYNHKLFWLKVYIFWKVLAFMEEIYLHVFI